MMQPFWLHSTWLNVAWFMVKTKASKFADGCRAWCLFVQHRRIHMYVCTHINMYACMCVRTYIGTYVCTRMCAHTHVHTHAHTYVRTYVRTYICMYIHARMHIHGARAHAHTRAHTYTRMHARTHTCTHGIADCSIEVIMALKGS